MLIKFKTSIDKELNFSYATQVLKQGINIKTICPNYILEFRNTNSYLLYVYFFPHA